MILCHVDESGKILTMSYSQHIGPEEMGRCVETVRGLTDQLKPGFLVLTDLSNLESMDAACATELGSLMDLCREKGMSTVIRVIPEPDKDIGFAILSQFHHPPPIKTHTFPSLAEAINSLIDPSEIPSEAGAAS